MPTTHPTELKVKTIRHYENGESVKSISEDSRSPKAPSINGTKITAPLKHLTALTPQKNLMPFAGDCGNKSTS